MSPDDMDSTAIALQEIPRIEVRSASTNLDAAPRSNSVVSEVDNIPDAPSDAEVSIPVLCVGSYPWLLAPCDPNVNSAIERSSTSSPPRGRGISSVFGPLMSLDAHMRRTGTKIMSRRCTGLRSRAEMLRARTSSSMERKLTRSAERSSPHPYIGSRATAS